MQSKVVPLLTLKRLLNSYYPWPRNLYESLCSFRQLLREPDTVSRFEGWMIGSELYLQTSMSPSNSDRLVSTLVGFRHFPDDPNTFRWNYLLQRTQISKVLPSISFFSKVTITWLTTRHQVHCDDSSSQAYPVQQKGCCFDIDQQPLDYSLCFHKFR